MWIDCILVWWMNMLSGHNEETKYLEKIGGKNKWIVWRNTVGRHDD